MLKVDAVTRRYGNFTAVDRVSFSLTTGEIVGFLGPNGSGKTTLMRVIATYLLPSEGTVYVDGIDVRKYPLEVLKRIGYLPESNMLYYNMRVGDYLSFVGKIRGLSGSKFKERFAWCVESMKLQEVLAKKNMECSKGFKQRISLAAALIHDPRVVIMDEPTAGLDPLQIFAFRDFIKSLSSDKVILLSSHILQEVASLAHRVVIIHQGHQIADTQLQDVEDRTEQLEKIFEAAIQNYLKGATQ